MNGLRRSLGELEEIRTHLLQDFFTLFVALFWSEEEWRQILFDGIKKESFGHHSAKYSNFMRTIENKGQDNITIKDMDTALICNVLLYFNKFSEKIKQLDRNLPSVLTFFNYDRNGGIAHSNYNESNYDLFITCIGSIFQMNQLITILKDRRLSDKFKDIAENYDQKLHRHTKSIVDLYSRFQNIDKKVERINQISPNYDSLDHAIIEQGDSMKLFNLLATNSQHDLDEYEYYYYSLSQLGSLRSCKYLCSFYIMRNRYDDAVEIAKKALRLSEDDPSTIVKKEDLQLYLASIYIQAPEYEKMREEGQSIINSIESRYHLRKETIPFNNAFVLYQTSGKK